jgi:hypothetical protein
MPFLDIGPHSNQRGGFYVNCQLLNLRGLSSILQVVSTIAPRSLQYTTINLRIELMNF